MKPNYAVLALLLVTNCTPVTGSGTTGDEHEPVPARTYLDVRLAVKPTQTASVTTGATLTFVDVAGPTVCEGDTCVTSPVTTAVTVDSGRIHDRYSLNFLTFAPGVSYTVGYVGATTDGTSDFAYASIFRVVEEAPQPVTYGVPVTISVAQPGRLPDQRLVRVDAFDVASRCGCNQLCVWEGLTEARVTIYEGTRTRGRAWFNDHMNRDDRSGNPVAEVAGLRLHVTDVWAPLCRGFVDEGVVELTVAPANP